MAIGDSSFSRRNSLLQRVQRHRSLPVIFRTVETVPKPPWDDSRARWIGAPPVRATLASPDVRQTDVVAPVAAPVAPLPIELSPLVTTFSAPPGPRTAEPMTISPIQHQVSSSEAPPGQRQAQTLIAPTPVSQKESDRLSAILRKHEEKRTSSDKTQAVMPLADRIEAPWLKRLARKQEQTSLDKPTITPHERPKPKMPETPQQRRRSQVQYVSGHEPEFTISPPTETDGVAPTVMLDSPPPTNPIQRQNITEPLQSDMVKGDVMAEEGQRMEPAISSSTSQPEPKPQAMLPTTSDANKPGAVVQRQASDEILSDDEVPPEMIRPQSTISEVSSPAPEALVTPPVINVDEEGSDEKPERVQRRETAISTPRQFISQPGMTPTVITHDEETEPPLSAVDRGESDPQTEIEAGLDETELNAESQESMMPGTSSSTLPQAETETAELTESFAQTDEYYQPISLQEALLMQKKSAPPTPKAPELIQPTSITPPTQELVRHETQDDALVREHLQQVSAGQSSDSSVELVMPRRPRPTLMRRSQSSVQPPETPGGAEAKLVDTEIGALPSDLWQLLKQAPPTTAPITPTTGAREAPIQNGPVNLSPPERVLPNIQRETYVPSSISPAPNENGASDVATADGATDETEEDEETEIDAEALAQEVYRKLKRRLQFDRERSGRV